MKTTLKTHNDFSQTLSSNAQSLTYIEEGYFYYKNTDYDNSLNQKHSTIFHKSILTDDSQYEVIVLHDVGEYHARYSHLYEALNTDVKINMHFFDWPGHGLSSGTRGLLYDFKHLAQIFLTYLDKKFENKKNKKFIIWGHGVGANLLEYLLIEHFLDNKISLQGILLSSPYSKTRFKIPIWSRPLLKLNSNQINKVNLPQSFAGQLRLESLLKVSEFNSDAFNSQVVSLSNIVNMVKLVKHSKLSSYFLDLPSMVMIGARDKIIDSESTLRYFKQNYPDGAICHRYARSGHDLQFDQETEKVCRDIVDWIKSIVDN